MPGAPASTGSPLPPALERAGSAAARRALWRAAKGTFAVADLALGEWPGPRLVIYHRVTSGLGREMELPFEFFRRQLDWLLEHGEIVDLESALERRHRPESRRCYVLTFDDGYEDLHRLAFPLLRQRRVPFVLYLTTEPVTSGRHLGQGGEPVSWDQVREMLESGLMTLGAHTHLHQDLRGREAGEVAADLDQSNELIERHTGVRPLHFAYPKGYWDPVAEVEVRKRYQTAVLGAGRPITAISDLHRLHRLPVQRSDELFFFRRKMVGGMRLEERVRSSLKGYRHPPR
ncbi:MAG: polysaccharide deacetylase family protein [Actinomycetota bacterium]|nr:polysaccharide deacetylase family protein [Actinomycetota bacterium]